MKVLLMPWNPKQEKKVSILKKKPKNYTNNVIYVDFITKERLPDIIYLPIEDEKENKAQS
jgi:hypothetical protein